METGRQDGGSDKNHAPFSVGETGNISRKFLTIILKIFDKNFERLQAAGAASSVSGNNVTLTFPATAECPMMVGLHLDGAAKQVEEVRLDSYDYSVN